MYCRYYLHPFMLPQLVRWLLLSNPNPTCGRQPPFRTKQRKVQQQQQPIAAAPTPPVLLFHGTLVNEFMEPLSNAFVQFWQADIHGNYAHPGNDFDFPHHAEGGPQNLLTDSFSYFGTARTDIRGNFAFRTYRPGIYASRPITHIHYKVFSNTTTSTTTNNNSKNQNTIHPQKPQLLLTSQFYFDDENIHGILAGYDDRQILTLKEEEVDEDDHEDENEDPSRLVWTTTKTIVVNAMERNNLTERGQQYLSNVAVNNVIQVTPWDMEGPFYPVVEFWEAGNDLTTGMWDTQRQYRPPVLPTVPVPTQNQEDNDDDDTEDGVDDIDDDTSPTYTNSNVDDRIDDDNADDANVEETEQDGGIQLSPNTTSSSNDVTVGNAHPDSNDATLNWEFEDTKHNNTKNNDEDNAADVTSCVSIGTSF